MVVEEVAGIGYASTGRIVNERFLLKSQIWHDIAPAASAQVACVVPIAGADLMVFGVRIVAKSEGNRHPSRRWYGDTDPDADGAGRWVDGLIQHFDIVVAHSRNGRALVGGDVGDLGRRWEG